MGDRAMASQQAWARVERCFAGAGRVLMTVIGAACFVGVAGQITSGVQKALPRAAAASSPVQAAIDDWPSGVEKITDPAQLMEFAGVIDRGGYNCPHAFGVGRLREDVTGRPFMVGCSTGIFQVTLRPAAAPIIAVQKRF